MTDQPDLKPEDRALREAVARIVDHEGYWERLDSCNHALATVQMNAHQRHALTAVRDDELRGTAESLAKADAILALLGQGKAVEGWKPTHRHVKSGGYYQVIERAKDITNEHGNAGVKVVIYRGVGGHTWVRRASEFDDGRFEPIAAASAHPEAGGGDHG